MSAALFCAASLSATACDKSSGDKAAAQAPKAPVAQVSLPPAPNFQAARVQEKWEDGSYSIYGLRSNIDERVKEGDGGQDVTVKGFVQSVYQPTECPEGEFCAPSKQPHFWITDKADQKGKKRAMMVVNYQFQIPAADQRRWRKVPAVEVEAGKRYTIKGKFKRFSETGFAHDNGLLEFVAIKPLDESGAEMDEWRFPRGAAWHPLETERAEAANKKMLERAEREKKKASRKKRRRK